MTARRARVVALSGFLSAVLAGCGFVPGIGNDTLHILNNTTIPVSVVVNDQDVDILEPSSSADIEGGSLPTLPWHVEVRTSGGRDLVALDVPPGSVHDEPNLDGTGSYSAPATRIDLSCGQVRIYVGRMMPGGPVPGPGSPGDCDP
jgi:hypothetical protein